MCQSSIDPELPHPQIPRGDSARYINGGGGDVASEITPGYPRMELPIVHMCLLLYVFLQQMGKNGIAANAEVCLYQQH